MAASTPDPCRTRLLAEKWGTWVLPHWLERQCDPRHSAFTPVGAEDPVTNSTNRNRMAVGNLDGGALATVDPRGLVTLDDGAWSLDWWIGGDDRWHLPSREAAVRQALVADAPVVETTMRVPSGNMIHRVWAFHDPQAGDVVAVELENASHLPVAVAMAVRPYSTDGAGRVESISVTDDRVVVDGAIGLWLDKPPHRVAVSNWAGGDASEVVFGGLADEGKVASVSCPDGLATAAVIFPLAHKATMRFLVPISSGVAPSYASVPPADAVARGWAAHRGSGVRLELPDPDLEATLAVTRAQLLLAASGRELAGSASTVDTAAVIGTLDRLGLHDAARAVVATLARGQGPGGRLGGDDPASEATSAAVVTAARHWVMAREADLAAELAAPVAAGAHYRGRPRPFGRRSSDSPSPLELGWRLRAMLDGAEVLDGGDQPEAAEAVRELTAEVRAQLDAAVDAVSEEIGAAHLGLLELVVPLGLVDPGHETVSRVLDWARARLVHEGGIAQVVGSTGLSPALTSLVGRVELRRGEHSALDRLEWLIPPADVVQSWSDLIHPRLGTGCGGRGWSPVAAAAVAELVLDLAAYESHGEPGLVLYPLVPDAWLGSGVEVHDLPTRWGLLSYAVRWHGARPALLWDLLAHDPDVPVTLTIPGLDPTWSTTEPKGEALLSAPVRPATESVLAAEGESFA